LCDAMKAERQKRAKRETTASADWRRGFMKNPRPRISFPALASMCGTTQSVACGQTDMPLRPETRFGLSYSTLKSLRCLEKVRRSFTRKNAAGRRCAIAKTVG
jgi:hypothetical protein